MICIDRRSASVDVPMHSGLSRLSSVVQMQEQQFQIYSRFSHLFHQLDRDVTRYYDYILSIVDVISTIRFNESLVIMQISLDIF